jgi:phosphoadenosine phosphosulfate reductase
MADFSRLGEIHPDLKEKLENYLKEYASRNGLPHEWVKYGFWRWQVLPKSICMIAEKKGINIVPKSENKPVGFTMTLGYRPCKTGGISAEGSFGTPLNLSRIEETGLMHVIGNVNSIDGVILTQRDDETVHIYASGTLVARASDEERTGRLMGLAEKTIMRALSCTKCGVCVGQCSVRAIKLDGDIRVNDNCTRCGKCTHACPVVRFG